MDKRFIAILAGASLLGVEVGEIEHGRYWMSAADHNHTEIPESVACDFSRRISVDSGATATAGTTGLLKSFPPAFIIVK